jgi:hypothetical protein
MTRLCPWIALDLGSDSAVVVTGGAILRPLSPAPVCLSLFRRREQRVDSIEMVIGPVHRYVSRSASSGWLMGQRVGARADIPAGR